MEQWNDTLKGWKISKVYGLEEIFDDKKKLKEMIFTMDDMLRIRYLMKMLNHLDTIIVKENQNRIELKCEEQIDYNLQEIPVTEADDIIDKAIQEVSEEEKEQDIVNALRKILNIIQVQVELEVESQQNIDTYIRNKRRELMMLLKIILGEENIEKLKKEKNYKLSLHNIEFFNYLLNTYENREVTWKKKEGVVKNTDGYFWDNVEEGLKGLKENENMSIKDTDVKRIIQCKFSVPYLKFMEKLQSFEDMVEKIKRLSTDDKNNALFFEEAGRLIDECNGSLCGNALKLDEYKKSQLQLLMSLGESNNEKIN